MVYLTGANGWLGLTMAQALAREKPGTETLFGGASRGLILPGTDFSTLKDVAPLMQIVEGDVRNGNGLDEFFAGGTGGVLIHTAGVIHPARIKDFYEVNRDGVRNVLDSAVKAGLKRVVIVSSNSPCGCNPHTDHLFDELSPYHPYMNYGKSKMEMEMLVMDYHQRGLIETVIVRAPWFYGINQPPRQILFFKMIKDGKVPVVGDGQNLRSMAYTGNLVQGLKLAATVERANGEIYWIADERPYSMNEIITTIERLLEEEFEQDCKHTRMHLPGLASEVAYCLDAVLQSFGLYHQKIHVLSEMNKTIACRIDKAKRELGYVPEVSLEEGMRRSLAEVYRPRHIAANQ